MELTKEMELKIKENIKQCVEWLSQNADDEESVWVDYNYDERDGKYKDTIAVNSKARDASVKTGNLWGYHTNWRSLEELTPTTQLHILEQWDHIKTEFNRKKMELSYKRNATINLINDFTV